MASGMSFYNTNTITTTAQVYDIVNELAYAIFTLRECFGKIADSTTISPGTLLGFEIFYTGISAVSDQILGELVNTQSPVGALVNRIFDGYLQQVDSFLEQYKSISKQQPTHPKDSPEELFYRQLIKISEMRKSHYK